MSQTCLVSRRQPPMGEAMTHACPSHHPRFEQMEPRLLLSVELPGMQLVAPTVDRFDGQVIYLDFDGEQNVTYNGPVTVGPFNVPAFQASGALAGQEADIPSCAARRLNELFAEAGVRFTLERPENDMPYSTIYVGGTDAPFREYGTFFGLAEHVDVGNLDHNDRAFVFSDNIDLTQPMTVSNDRSLSGVIAHETGRLLGYANAQAEAFDSPLASVAAVAPDADRTFTHPAENNGTKNITLAIGTYTFEVDADPNGDHRVDWFTTYSGTSGLKETAYLYYYDDSDFTFSSSGNYWVRAEVYRSDFWNNTYEWEAAYRWYVTVPQPNRAPNPPSSPTPSSGQTNVSTSADVYWSCSDPDGDTLYYTVYLEQGDSSPDNVIENDSTGSSADPGSMQRGAHYYWQVKADDHRGGVTSGPVWDFYTKANQPPSTPSSPDPYSGQTSVARSANLYWSCSDGDGDSLYYTVYLEKDDSTPDNSIKNDSTGASADPPGDLDYGSHYYWQVKADDHQGGVTLGPVWDFYTVEQPRVTDLSWRVGPNSSDGEVGSKEAGQTIYLRADAVGMNGQTINVEIWEDDGWGDNKIETKSITIGSQGFGTTLWTAQWRRNDDDAPWSKYYIYYSPQDLCSGPDDTGDLQVTDTQGPSSFDLGSPTNGDVLSDSSVAFSWSSSDDPWYGSGFKDYTLQVDDNSNFGSPMVNHTGLVGTSRTETISGEGMYYWRVIAYDNNSNPTYSSSTRSFQWHPPLSASVFHPHIVFDLNGNGFASGWWPTDDPYFIFTPSASGTATFSHGYADTDATMRLYLSNGTWLKTESEGDSSNSMSYAVTAGTEYSLWLDTPTWMFDFSVSIDLPSPPVTNIVLDTHGDKTYWNQYIDPSSEGEYWRYAAPASGPLDVEADSVGGVGWDTDLFVFNAAGSLIYFDTGSVDDGDYAGDVTAGQVVYFLVRGDVNDEGSDSTGQYDLYITGPEVNLPPTISVTAPGAGGASVELPGDYTIRWDASDPNGTSPTITLYYDGDNSPGGETLIASGLPHTGNYLWDVPSGLAGQQVYVKGVASDGSLVGTDYSDGRLTVVPQNRPPTTPGTIVASDVTPSSARVTWGLSTDPDGDSITYTVQWKGDWTPTWLWASTGTTASTFYDITGLDPEKVYDVRVMASDGEPGGDSDWHDQENVITTPSPTNGEFMVMVPWQFEQGSLLPVVLAYKDFPDGYLPNLNYATVTIGPSASTRTVHLYKADGVTDLGSGGHSIEFSNGTSDYYEICNDAGWWYTLGYIRAQDYGASQYSPGGALPIEVAIAYKRWALDLFDTDTVLTAVVQLADSLPSWSGSDWGWYAGDTHFHSDLTDTLGELIEFGTPLSVASLVGDGLGLDWFTFTDHSNLLGGTNDIVMSLADYRADPISVSWRASPLEPALGGDWVALPIKGEEITVSEGNNFFGQHLLAYGFGDGDDPVGSLTGDSLARVMNALISGSGATTPLFAYAAHPSFSGGITEPWTPLQTEQAYGFTDSAGRTILCGFEFWNSRSASAEREASLDLWEDTLAWIMASDTETTNHHWYLVGGSDDHAWSSSVWDDTTLMGDVRTVVCAPSAAESDVLDALRNGRALVTDGPWFAMGLDNTGDEDFFDYSGANPDTMVGGQKVVTSPDGGILRFDWPENQTGSPWGRNPAVSDITLFHYKDTGEWDGREIGLTSKEWNAYDDWAAHSVEYGSGWQCYRAELDLNGYKAYTNPIWLYFDVADAVPPTADLATPPSGSAILRSTLNARGYIDVTFADSGGSGLDLATITDSGHEFTLSGPGVGTVVIASGTPSLVSGTTYRYAFTGSFGTGQVNVNFTAGAWADTAGNTNAAETEAFTVSADPSPPEIQVRHGGANIPDGSPSPVPFGTVQQGSPAPELTFTIYNLGDQDLSVGTVYLDNNAGFTVSQQPASVVSGWSQTTLKIRMDAGTAGPKSADVRFSNGDSDENPFNFKVAGSVAVAVNHLPVAVDDAAATDEDTPVVTPNVLANDTDVDDDPLSIVAFTQAAHGTVANNGNGTFTYRPTANYNGPDTFTYTVSDGKGGRANASVTITVNAVNDRPVATAQSVTVNEDGTVTITLAGTDVETPAGSLVAANGTQPAHGTLTLLSGNQYRYTPAANYNGSDSFTFTVRDNGDPAGSHANPGDLASDPATVSITVAPVNDRPVATPQSVAVSTDGSVEIVLAGTDVETPAASLIAAISTQPAHGTLTLVSDNRYRYAPAAGYSGSDSFTFTMRDTGDPAGSHANPGDLTSSPVAVSITVNAGVPVLAVAPMALDFGPTGTSLAFTVQNGGGGAMAYTIQVPPVDSWLTVSPASGTCTTQTDTITVTAKRDGLPPGPCMSVIVVNAGVGGTAVISVTMEVPETTQRVLIEVGDQWRYLKGNFTPSPAWYTIWKGLGFDDSTWATGGTPIGYSDGDVTYTTTLDDMLNNYLTFYTRKAFTVGDPDAVMSLDLDMAYDDGFVAYINGVEVARANMGNVGSPVTIDMETTDNHEETHDPTETFPITLSPGLLRSGTNVLAIEVHNNAIFSPDACLSARLRATVASQSLAQPVGRLAYTQWKGNSPAKYSVMDLPSGSVNDLSLSVTPGSGPQWSPDGQWLTFSDTSNNVFKVRADGSGLAQLTQGGGSWVWPSFSPDGTQIVYHQIGGHLYTIANDGTNVTQLPVSGGMPRWSQGPKIAYTNWGFTYDSDIFVYDLVTQDSTQVTHHAPGEAYNFATWSPDGEKLAVARRDGTTGLYDILIMNPDGSGSVNITAGWTDTDENLPCWSPDGQYVLFQSDKGGNWDIWAMRADLTGLVNLTNTPDINEACPAMNAPVASQPLRVVGVTLNQRPERGVSAIEPSGIGVRTIEVVFNKPAMFDAAAIHLETVRFDAGREVVTGILVPVRLTGSNTNVMALTFDNATVVDTWVKVTVMGDGLRDSERQALDGEPRQDGSGRPYIYSSTADLPSGDGVPGGDAVFYVGSLRGDFSGEGGGAPDGRVNEADIDAFWTRYGAGSKDADFRGQGFTASNPDGLVTPSDIDGFLTAYNMAVAEGRPLDPLPSFGPQGEGAPEPVASAFSPKVLSNAPAQLLELTAPLAANESPVATLALEDYSASLPAETGILVMAPQAVSSGASAFLASSDTFTADDPPLLLLTATSTPLAWSTAKEIAPPPDPLLSPDGGVESLLVLPER